MDQYRYEVYSAIKSPETWIWGPFLGGHIDKSQKKVGLANRTYEGALTENPNTRFHSCDSREACPVRDSANVVQIIPVTTHTTAVEEKVSNLDHFGSRAMPDGISQSVAVKQILERRRPLEPSPKDVDETILKEPGHTLLEPRTHWWVEGTSEERVPIISEEGEPLPHYLVYILIFVANVPRSYLYRVTRL